MCNTKSLAVDRAIADVERPMKWAEAEQLAQDFSKEAISAWYGIVDELYGWIRGLAEERGDRAINPNTYKALILKDRNPTEGDVEQSRNDLGQYLTEEEIEAGDRIFQNGADQFAPEGLGDVGIWAVFLPIVLADAWRKAHEFLSKNARATGNLALLENLTPELDAYQLGITGQAFLKEGYQLVRSKVSFAARGLVYQELLSGLVQGLPWTDISRNVWKKAGAGYLYHWKRLIRTEMVSAHYTAFTQRYKKAGIKYMKWTTSLGACPICIDRSGFYEMSSHPKIPAASHPNCRCLYLPYYRLPEGAELKLGIV